MTDRSIKAKAKQQRSRTKDNKFSSYVNKVEDLMEARNWTDTSLGPRKTWPKSFQVAWDICLKSPTPMAIFWGEDLMFLYNDAWGDLLENHSLFGRSAREVFNSRKGLVKALKQVISTGESHILNNKRLPFPSRETSRYDLSISPLRNEQGAVGGVFNVAHKSNSAKQAKEPGSRDPENVHITKRGHFLDSLFKTTPECIKVLDEAGTILRMNPAGLKMVQADSSSNIVGKNIIEVIATEHKKKYQDFHKRVCNGEKGILEFDVITLKGQRRHMQTHAAPLRNSDGSYHHLALTHDITERKQKEAHEHFLLELNDVLRPLTDPDKMKTAAAQFLGEYLQASRVSYADVDSNETDFTFAQNYVDGVPDLRGTYKLDRYGPQLMDELREGHTLSIADVTDFETEPRLQYADAEVFNSGDIRSFVSVPLVKNEQLLACLDVHQAEPRQWEQNEIDLIQETAERTWDVVERARSEKALRESTRKYRTLFESMDEGYCIIEMIFDEEENPVDYKFLEVNPSFEDHTGMEDVEGKTMREIIPGHEQDWFETYGKVAQTREPVRFEQISRGLGRIFELYAFPFGKPEDNQVAVLFQDISQRKENERADALLGAIVEGSDDAIISKNLDGIITSWNSGAEKIFGYTEEETIGQSVTMLMPPERVSEEEHILNQLRQGNRLEHFETIRQHKDGTLLNVSLTISPIRDQSGEIIGASKIARDITKRKKTEAQLQELNESLEHRVRERTKSLLSYQEQLRTLASKLSKAEELERHRLATELHDNLGQMLAVGKMKIDLMRKDVLPEGLTTSVEELKELLDDALIYTRELMSDLKPPPSLDKEDVRASINWVAQKMGKHGLKVEVEDDNKPKPVNNEIRTTLLQCVRELLFNVIKHTNVSEARVRMVNDVNQVLITVEDEGAGFDPDEVTSTSTEDGGFGLFNIKERMDLLGGSIEVTSIPGKGTEAKLLAPLKRQEQSPAEPEPSEESLEMQGNEEEVHVLLVDDHKMMREGLRKIVEEQDDLIVVAEASDGKQAVEAVKEKSPDVVVMDIDMPGMNGIDATHKIMSDGEDLRVIGLSLHGHESVVESMRKAGASAYLTKNEAFETLCATIRSEAATAKD